MKPQRPNESGETTATIRWTVELPSGQWIGAYSADAIDEFVELVRQQALEEAAKLCDEMQPIPASEPRHCAQDIRSLK